GQQFRRPARGLVSHHVPPPLLLVVRRGGAVVLRDVAEHEPPPQAVAAHPALPPHPLGAADAPHRGWPDLPGRVQRNQLPVPPSPRTPSVTRMPRTEGGQTIPVGWNCTNSMSISSAPAL